MLFSDKDEASVLLTADGLVTILLQTCETRQNV